MRGERRPAPSVTPGAGSIVTSASWPRAEGNDVELAVADLDRRGSRPSGAVHGDPHRDPTALAAAAHDRRPERDDDVVAEEGEPLTDLVVRKRAERAEQRGSVDAQLRHAERPHAVEQDARRLAGMGSQADRPPRRR